MRIFVLGLPHTQTNTEFTTCAFTMKAYHLCKMMHKFGHEVVHLGVEGSNPACSENVSVMPESRWRDLYGKPGAQFYNLETQAPGYKEYHADFAANMRAEIVKRTREPNSAIICVTWGGAQQTAVQDLPQFVVESGIGYINTWAKYRVFESHAWAHMLYGKAGKFDGMPWYDAVIPNAFDPGMFEFRETPGDYLLYLGRLNADKGISVACDIAKQVGMLIKIVGQGDPTPFLAPHVEYAPPVGVEARRGLLAGAKALLCPTFYVEPFGGVNIEAQMSGTPVIATDWGAFPETVLHGVTGYLGRTMEEFTWAARNLDKLSRKACRDWAVANYSLDHVALLYEEYFQRLLDIGGAGWYTERPYRTQLDSRRRIYPTDAPAPVISMRSERFTPITESLASVGYVPDGEDWPGLVNAVVETLKPTSVLDLGCGPCRSLARFKEHGLLRIIGIDGSIALRDNQHVKPHTKDILFVDLERSPCVMGEKFDLVWSYEVAEHVANEENFLLTLTENARHWIVMTAAIPGQGGIGHVNCQTREHWISKLSERGFAYRGDLTEQFRALGRNVTGYYDGNGMVFERRSEQRALDIKVGAHFACYKNKRATFEALKAFRQHFPHQSSSPVHLCSDAGDAFNDLAMHFDCLYTHYTEPVGNGVTTAFDTQIQAMRWFERLRDTCLRFTDVDWIVILEDDVRTQGPIRYMPPAPMAGPCTMPFTKAAQAAIHARHPHLLINGYSGCGGTIIHRETYLKAFENFYDIAEAAKLDERLARHSDAMLTFLFLWNGFENAPWADHSERSRGVGLAEAAFDHQFKAFYSSPWNPTLLLR
jgi:glycosyltransferase involved in cell wall biosynthesis